MHLIWLRLRDWFATLWAGFEGRREDRLRRRSDHGRRCSAVLQNLKPREIHARVPSRSRAMHLSGFALRFLLKESRRERAELYQKTES
jgi:hypothetical protein